MQLLPGFRDFYPAECARRNYILDTWRSVARRYGFVEYDGPVLEPLELYQKKSGNEIVSQLFNFVDKGERAVSLRPEMTPTVARMVAARERDFKKPHNSNCSSVGYHQLSTISISTPISNPHSAPRLQAGPVNLGLRIGF